MAFVYFGQLFGFYGKYDPFFRTTAFEALFPLINALVYYDDDSYQLSCS